MTFPTIQDSKDTGKRNGYQDWSANRFMERDAPSAGKKHRQKNDGGNSTANRVDQNTGPHRTDKHGSPTVCGGLKGYRNSGSNGCRQCNKYSLVNHGVCGPGSRDPGARNHIRSFNVVAALRHHVDGGSLPRSQ
jgi:hypothetical protein